MNEETAVVGVPWVLEDEDAFKRDWEVHGLTLKELAALHGFKNINSVSRAAKRLGLPKRRGGRPPASAFALPKEGRWVLDPVKRVQRWVEP